MAVGQHEPRVSAAALTGWPKALPAGTRGRLLDPCADEGEIADLLGKLLNCETWGCELFPYRAENAAASIDKCHSAAWESCSLIDESVTFLLANLPYDDDRHGDEKRLELAFLKSTTPKLVTLARLMIRRSAIWLGDTGVPVARVLSTNSVTGLGP